MLKIEMPNIHLAGMKNRWGPLKTHKILVNCIFMNYKENGYASTFFAIWFDFLSFFFIYFSFFTQDKRWSEWKLDLGIQHIIEVQ